jgi:hypothetical protein
MMLYMGKRQLVVEHKHKRDYVHCFLNPLIQVVHKHKHKVHSVFFFPEASSSGGMQAQVSFTQTLMVICSYSYFINLEIIFLF